MAHSYRVHYFHLVWATKNREPWIDDTVQAPLYAYLAGIISRYDGKLLEAGGMPDHVHLLVKLSGLDNYSKLLRDLKCCSSGWVHKKYPDLYRFAWQSGFGSFSVSVSGLARVREYIRRQEEHHQLESFEDEYKRFLKMHSISYDERFVLG